MISRIILTSNKSYHQKALQLIDQKHTAYQPELLKDPRPVKKPSQTAIRYATAKAQVAAQKHRTRTVLGLHTLAVYRNQPLDPPKFKMDALAMLKDFITSSHVVITAWALVDLRKDTKHTGYAETRVFFRNTDEETLTHYVNDHDVVSYPTGYHPYQTNILQHIEKIEGSASNFFYHLPIEQITPLLQ